MEEKKHNIAGQLILLSLFTLGHVCFGQKRVLPGTVLPGPKAETAVNSTDTSLVLIEGQAYCKVVAVSYMPVDEAKLQMEYMRIKEETERAIAEEKGEREYAEAEIARLKAKLQTTKGLYNAAAKQLKFTVKDATKIENPRDKILQRQESRKALIEIVDNPRKKGKG